MERWARSIAARIILNLGPKEVIKRHKGTREFLLRTRQSRLDALDQSSNPPGCLTRLSLGTVKTVLEYVPIPIPGYGVGDVIVLTEGISRRYLPNMERMDKVDASASIILAVVPIIPAVISRAAFSGLRRSFEESANKVQNDIDRGNLPPHG